MALPRGSRVPGIKRGSASRFRRASLDETRSPPCWLTQIRRGLFASHQTAGRARPGHAGPAALLQDPGLEQGRLARMAVDVAPAVTGGQDALGSGLVVPVGVAQALLVRMRQPAVELGG